MASKTGKTICIFSAKGGVGKTIMTTNLAGICETLKRKTLIIDLDLTSGGISVALNAYGPRNIYHLIDDYINNRHHDFSEYVVKYDEYIDVLASPRDPRQGNKIEALYIDDVIKQASYNYDVVLIDMNHILNDVNLVALDTADRILFMMTNDPFDLKNMKSVLSIFRYLEIDKYKVILNNSRDVNKNYFNLFDIKNIIKSNIDYTISSKLYISNLDTYIMNGKIITLHPKCSSIFPKDYMTLSTIMIDILGEGLEENKK